MINDRRGVAALEFAFAVPVMLIIIYGLTELVRYVRTDMLFRTATTDMAELVAAQQGVTSGSSGLMNDFCTGALYTLSTYPTGNFAPSVASVTNFSSGVSRDWEYDSACPNGGANIGKANAVTLGSPLVPNQGDSVIVVQASFAYVPIIKGIISPITFKATRYSRPRYGAVLCTVAGSSNTACPTLP